MAPPLISLRSTDLTFGGTPLLEGADLSVGAQDRICLVGRNGSGKSTLLKIAAGLLQADRGERVLQTGTTVRYLPQEPDLSAYPSLIAYVEAGLGPSDDPFAGRRLLEDLGLDPDRKPEKLSGGESRRAALAAVLAPDPDVLLLDEPTNHLDLPAIAWLERELASRRAALVLISHDRRFLESLGRTSVWLDRGKTRRLEDNFRAFEAWRDDLLEQEEAQRHKLDRKIAAELDWVRYGVTARRKRNQGRLRSLQGLRQERRDQRRATGQVTMAASEGLSSGKLVLEAKGVSKAWGGRPIITDFSTLIRRGDRVGLIGPNGAGKTTLLDILTGKLAPDAGNVRLGANLQLVGLDQARRALDNATSLQDTLTDGRGDTVFIGGQPRHVQGYLKDFLFQPEQARTPVGALSGGERGRLMLAKALAMPSNVLALDEPTNDLDLETLDLLQELIADYPGTVLLVSHDRDFLDRTVTSVIAYDGPGRWSEYAGGYSDMILQRGHGVDARVADGAPVANGGSGKPRQEPLRPTAPPKLKLGPKEQHALKTLPAAMSALGREIATLQATLANPMAGDPQRLAATAARLAAAEGELAAAEERWLELELRREAMAAS